MNEVPNTNANPLVLFGTGQLFVRVLRRRNPMRKCRIIQFDEVSEAFLAFCVNYDTPDREKYRAKYEGLEQREMEVKGAIPQIIEQREASAVSA